MMFELNEREKCTFNFIVHNLPESCSTIPFERITSDSKNLTNILSPLAISLPSNFKLIRLGRIQPNITQILTLKLFLKLKMKVFISYRLSTLAKDLALQYLSPFHAIVH